MDILAYYASHSPITDPGRYAYLYEELPDDLEGLVQAIHAVLLHKLDAAYQRVPLTRISRREQLLRTMEQRLGHIVSLDPAPLTVARAPKERQIGWCREFAVFMVSMLRHKGIPARLRVGFMDYFVQNPRYRGDHWISEHWDVARGAWRLTDPNLAGLAREDLQAQVQAPLRAGLDLMDLRYDDEFYVAGYAWKLARAGELKADLCRANLRWKGWPCIRGNLLHDWQALNKTELLIWDYWDELSRKPEREMTAQDKALLDRIAALSHHPDENLAEMRALFEELPRTRVIRSRLRLLGVVDDGPGTVAEALQASDMERLLALAGGRKDVAGPPESLPAEARATPGWDGSDGIVVLGARQNNLKNIDVCIPRNKLVVITGVSGSGKSSLAFDTIYAEGQRRYVESLSSFARQFTRQMEKPLVDKVLGLNPAVAIEQRRVSPNSRSTVGSITEVLDYLRLLFARVGQMHCPQCGRAVTPQSAQQIAKQLVQLAPGTRLQVLAPVIRYGEPDAPKELARAREAGFRQARVDGLLVDLDEDISEAQEIELLAADLTVPQASAGQARREFPALVLEALERALELGQGIVVLLVNDEELLLNGDQICPVCALNLPRLEPQLLNYNTVYGMCPGCNGLGVELQVDPDLIISKPHRSLLDDASAFHMYSNLRQSSSQWWVAHVKSVAEYFGADLEQPWNELPEAFRQALLFGTGGKKIATQFAAEDGSFSVQRNRALQGAVHHINRLYRQTKSESQRRRYMQFMSQQPCPVCQGERLNKEARFVTLGGKRFPEVLDKSIGALLAWVRELKPGLDERQHAIGGELLAEIEQRLQFVCDVGLHYLTLDRPAPTLAGGEAQRIRLAGQIGSELVGVLYVLDEPSIGLHSRDQQALLGLLGRLRDEGNTVLVVEHDAAAMRAADWLIDLGPGAGVLGGELVAQGTPRQVMENPASLTGRYLCGDLNVISSNGRKRRSPSGWLTVRGARLHNLKRVEARFPLGTFTCITGVSGSGKSSLVTQTLYPALARALHKAQDVPGPHDGIEGVEQLRRAIHITQAPIGRNPRSNPGTYVGVLQEVRKLFASTGRARELGYPEGHFSFNVKGGRCEACEGYGANKVKLHFMADVWVRCQECEGRRFTPQVLQVHYHGQNIAGVLDMDVQAAHEFFADQPQIEPLLAMLLDVGLGYVKLGQSALTLSGGEAQRIKLARELGRAASGKTLYILDEPTTGLHFADIQKLLDILQRLVEAGNTVLVIEHNLDVVKSADWVMDLGPEGGEEGGYIVAQGAPEEVAQVTDGYTGQYLRRALGAPAVEATYINSVL